MIPEALTNQAAKLMKKIGGLERAMASPSPREILMLGTYYEQAAALYYLIGEFETVCTLQRHAYETCARYAHTVQIGTVEHQLRNSELARSLVRLALFLSLTKDHSNAKSLILRSIDLYNQLTPSLHAQKCLAYCAAGRIFRKGLEYDAAEQYLRKIPSLINLWDNEVAYIPFGSPCNMERTTILQKYLFELGVVFHLQHKDEMAKALLHKAIPVGSDNMIPSLIGLSMDSKIECSERLIAKAEVENALGNYELALRNGFAALDLQESILPSNHPLRCHSLVCIGQTYHGMGDLQTAREYFLRAQFDGATN